LTYHGDFIEQSSYGEKVLQTLSYKQSDLDNLRKEALNLYEAFYNYSDSKFNNAIKLKPVRVLLKYYIENSNLSSIRQDKDKEEFLDEF